ncbi:unnamed protein product [Eruca vesicaria subsp. sativa]|uniref:Cyclin N-terminal domain-containing protein n=1 Tax=Eruca vesicaria subsp. sativa TaxID=29727 RepID=A0ABC8K7K3_ERUVS|nr:unnamed protein product [Eruca vesicaria subsp. sativa]
MCPPTSYALRKLVFFSERDQENFEFEECDKRDREIVASDCFEAERGSNRLCDFFSSLLTSIGGGALDQIKEKEESSSMASRVSIPRGITGEVKPKNVVRQNRKALGDIGNLVNIATEKDIARKAKPSKAEEVVIITPHENEKSCKPHVTQRGSSKTFTATLRAQSKAANGLKDAVIDEIDALDAGNKLAAVEYVDDIFKFYKSIEEEGRIIHYMGSQPELNIKMRSILIDCLVDVHRKFELMPRHFTRELQLLGISAMLIACKYEEIWAPEVNDFVSISDNAYCREQVLAMEKSILRQLEWCITVPTPYVFLARYIKASVPCDGEIEKLVLYLAELGLMQCPLAFVNRPSILAASAVYDACQLLEKTPSWTETLKHHTGYSEDEIMEKVKMLRNIRDSALERSFDDDGKASSNCYVKRNFATRASHDKQARNDDVEIGG